MVILGNDGNVGYFGTDGGRTVVVVVVDEVDDVVVGAVGVPLVDGDPGRAGGAVVVVTGASAVTGGSTGTVGVAVGARGSTVCLLLTATHEVRRVEIWKSRPSQERTQTPKRIRNQATVATPTKT